MHCTYIPVHALHIHPLPIPSCHPPSSPLVLLILPSSSSSSSPASTILNFLLDSLLILFILHNTAILILPYSLSFHPLFLILDCQACRSSRCLTCPMMADPDVNIEFNNIKVDKDLRANCKTQDVIYLLQCPKCPPNSENSYIGQTRQELHNRMNGH